MHQIKITLKLTEDEYNTILQHKIESGFADKPFTVYTRYKLLQPKESNLTIDKRTQEDIQKLSNIMAVFAYFAEQSNNQEMQKLFKEYRSRVQKYLNQIL